MMKPPMNPRAAGRRRFLRGSLGLACVVAAADTGAAATRAALPERMAGPVAGGWRRHTLALGTRVSVTVAGLPPPQADAAAQAALAEIRRVEAAASLFNGSALLSRLNRAGELTTDDPHLMRLLQAADHWWQASGGAFDPSVQPLWQLHQAAALRGGLAAAADIEQRLALVGWSAVQREALADGRSRIVLPRPGMALTLNGIAQGYASDRAWAVLREHGVEHALVDAGEWRAQGRSAAGRPWRLGLRDALLPTAAPARLLQAVAVQDASLASSGIGAAPFSADGSLHHLLDPRSGRSPQELAGATVLAPDACSADALSTSCMLLGVDAALALLERLPGVEALLQRSDGALVRTSGWPS